MSLLQGVLRSHTDPLDKRISTHDPRLTSPTGEDSDDELVNVVRVAISLSMVYLGPLLVRSLFLERLPALALLLARSHRQEAHRRVHCPNPSTYRDHNLTTH
jgi:hypothetical protein